MLHLEKLPCSISLTFLGQRKTSVGIQITHSSMRSPKGPVAARIHLLLKHFDERLIASKEILGDELHWGSFGSVVEARDDDIGRLVKSRTSRQLLRELSFNLQNR